jgi:sterol desaturase/sphingolipid hydroxylase (fatty acid hydroxylase superfamily)
MSSLFDFPRLLTGLVILFVIFVPLERLFSIRPQRLFRKGWITDVTHFLINEGLRKILLGVTLLVVIQFLGFLVHPGLQAWIKAWPFWVQCVTAIVINDIGSYWGHRWAHQIPWLWRFHAVHHSSEHMDWLASARVHPVDQTFIRTCGIIPVYLLGFTREHFAVLLIFGGFLAIFIHANIRWRLGWLEWLIATPAFHHWHHTNEREHYDKNYAALLPWVDKLFGTFNLPNRMPEKYGIDEPMATSYLGQLAQPFRGEKKSDTAPLSNEQVVPVGTAGA